MTKTGSLYIEGDSIFHRLDGSIKFLLLICWTIFVFMFLDIRIFGIVLIVGLIMLKMSKLPKKAVLPLFVFMIVFTLINAIYILVITPTFGSKLAGHYTVLLHFGPYKLTLETLFYTLTLSCKYICMLPVTLIFIFTTHPSSFASSLNRVGISYKVAYAVNIALRYIPDVRSEVQNIINAQEARGVAFKRGDAPLFKRLKNYIVILLPLIISSLDRVEVISNAMDLRGFGRYDKRTWYSRRTLKRLDFIFLGLIVLLLIGGIVLRNTVFKGFWYPI
ncbi:energy-coupling factor transporter transmembrane component T family protein [Clostridium oryzae]|uniref:Energy-coupling factor transporter transmembrane protein EcfT n=1 Tax=Clostridium oryzae TaxID=1450648 RepID=A0A1V4I5U2_9CLOT|nr:energy-coupling factor transporter transmembrane component T [Clostridium oryzae]OPJ55361.1 energy-coupling factor transporter transmembrane protein EcfT [Clostridium oryzae]